MRKVTSIARKPIVGQIGNIGPTNLCDRGLINANNNDLPGVELLRLEFFFSQVPRSPRVPRLPRGLNLTNI